MNPTIHSTGRGFLWGRPTGKGTGPETVQYCIQYRAVLYSKAQYICIKQTALIVFLQGAGFKNCFISQCPCIKVYRVEIVGFVFLISCSSFKTYISQVDSLFKSK